MYEIITDVEINGSPKKVWRALTDFQSYPRWNPVIPSIKGVASTGQRLKVVFGRDGSMKMKFSVIVAACVPEREFTWVGQLIFAKVFAGNHYFLIQQLGPDRSRLVHGEKFLGLLKPLMWILLSKRNKSAFSEMNNALKTYVEGNTID